jgi:hypothetical protein
MAVKMLVLVFWVVMPCELVSNFNILEKHAVSVCRVTTQKTNINKLHKVV